MSRVVDFHVHMLEPTVFQACAQKTVFSGFGANPVTEPRPGAKALLERSMHAETVLEDMDTRHVDVSVLSSSTVLQGTSWADPQTDALLCEKSNNQLARCQNQSPNRLVASMVLPMQSIELALKELHRCANDLDIRVINLSTQYKGLYVGDPFFHDFWQAVEKNNLTVWIHPEGVQDPWFQRYALWNSLGQSIEETKCMASLIYEGVMTRCPNLKIVMAHGGGYFPHYMGRLDRNTLNRPDTVKNMDGQTPSHFLKNFYYDACVYDPQVLNVLIERVGVDRLVMGSDYPVGEKDPVAWLSSMQLEKNALDAIVGGNALKILELES
ncbi:MAG: amidohydrolase [Betaproteobacteria bacterium]|jgi:aminocarboxymuconate-semialdehyde decarboxylase|nr:amidohydrolase [Betaproteobacteria bacterium]